MVNERERGTANASTTPRTPPLAKPYSGHGAYYPGDPRPNQQTTYQRLYKPEPKPLTMQQRERKNKRERVKRHKAAKARMKRLMALLAAHGIDERTGEKHAAP